MAVIENDYAAYIQTADGECPLRDLGALRKYQGEENAGKIMMVGLDGIVTPVEMDETLTDNTKAAPAGVVGKLKDDLGNCIRYNSKSEKQEQEETKIVFNNVGKQLADNGTVIDNAVYSTTDFIDITDVHGIYRTGSTAKFSLWFYAFYDEDKNFLSFRSDGTNYDIVDYGDKKVTWLTLNTSAKYIRITMETVRDFYSYYSVKNISVTESYDVPMLTFNGEDILTEAKQGSTKINSITEYVTGNNIFDPSLLKTTDYYYDFADGTTHKSRRGTKLTEDFVELPQDTNSVCIRQKSQAPASAIILVYCYSDTAYLGYIFKRVDDIGANSYTYQLKTGTTKIKLYISSASFEGTDICISREELESFESYKLNLVVKKEALHNYDGFFSLKGKKIVNFGDSIFGNKRPPSDISTAISEITGATVYNLGFGGCRMAAHRPNWDAFSMYRLAYSIANNDFSVQDSVDIPSVSGMPSYFEETRELLKSIDFNNVDIITIAYGTNDFTAGIEIESEERLSTETYAGALRYSIEKILSAYPNIKIFICSQTYRFWIGESGDFEDDSDTHLISTKKLTDFVEKTKEVSNEYHLKFIDNYYDLGINKFNSTHRFPENDGTHHNVDGARLIAEHMVSEIF